MKVLFTAFLLAVLGAFFWRVSSTSTEIPQSWSAKEHIEYRWYVFANKFGIDIGPEQHARFRKMIDDALQAASHSQIESRIGSWVGHIYPNRTNLRHSTFLGQFPSLEGCRNAARARLAEIGSANSGDYECGRNCILKDAAVGLWVCNETRR